MKVRTILLIIGLTAIQAWGHASYTGYSGSPGRQACAISCHPRHAFTPTVTVTGFPTTYMPGQQYTVAVAHNGGSSIANFNCSVRVGTGSINAGSISAGTATAVYNVSGETNGVHFSSSSQNSGNFTWTAPAMGTGAVRLYLATLQGTLSNGADTQVVLISNENMTGIENDGLMPDLFTLDQNYPNPFNAETIIKFNLSQPGHVDLNIFNVIGQQVYAWSDEIGHSGPVSIRWDGKGRHGEDLPSGVYFYQVHTADGSLTRQMVLLR